MIFMVASNVKGLICGTKGTGGRLIGGCGTNQFLKTIVVVWYALVCHFKKQTTQTSLSIELLLVSLGFFQGRSRHFSNSCIYIYIVVDKLPTPG